MADREMNQTFESLLDPCTGLSNTDKTSFYFRTAKIRCNHLEQKQKDDLIPPTCKKCVLTKKKKNKQINTQKDSN